MIISEEEHLMYSIMRTIYESDIPISFKGSMVLKAFLIESGFVGDVRHTKDIDGNWVSDSLPSDSEMVESLQKAFRKSGLDLDVTCHRKPGVGRSAGFSIVERNKSRPLFTMDIDVNRPVPETKIYEVNGLSFSGVAPNQIIADKLAVVSSDAVFKRIKDMIDLYYLSKVFSLDTSEIRRVLRNEKRALGDFNAFKNRKSELEHSYARFRFEGDVTKPSFEEIYSSVKDYIKDML